MVLSLGFFPSPKVFEAGNAELKAHDHEFLQLTTILAPSFNFNCGRHVLMCALATLLKPPKGQEPILHTPIFFVVLPRLVVADETKWLGNVTGHGITLKKLLLK